MLGSELSESYSHFCDQNMKQIQHKYKSNDLENTGGKLHSVISK